MGNLGSGEILAILLVALLVLGPTRLPQAARQVGRAMAEFRRVTGGLQAEVRDAMAEFEREVSVDDTQPAPTAIGDPAWVLPEPEFLDSAPPADIPPPTDDTAPADDGPPSPAVAPPPSVSPPVEPER